LWDIKGKALGVPVYELLGGYVRDRIRMYGWVGGDDPSGIADAIQAQLDVGLMAVKMNAASATGPLGTVAEIDRVLERVAAAREVRGLRRAARPALPSRPDRTRRLFAGRLHHTELADPGAEHQGSGHSG